MILRGVRTFFMIHVGPDEGVGVEAARRRGREEWTADVRTAETGSMSSAM